jgi:voltage-gated sodium channel
MTHHIKSFVESKPFHHFIVAVIVLAGVAAGLETSAAIMAKHGATLLALAKLILGIFIAEALLKIATHGRKPWRCFADAWNVFTGGTSAKPVRPRWRTNCGLWNRS